MKKIKQQKILVLFTFMALVIMPLHAQIKDVGKMMTGGTADAQVLFTEYLRPYANALGADLSGGWYNTAKPHALGGFDITFTLNMAFVPDEAKVFNPSALELSGMSTATSAPTAAGEKVEGAAITYDLPANQSFSYNTPKGTGVGFIPTPMIQAGVGLFKDTELIGRFMPSVDIGNSGSSIGLWGVGLKHGLNQWIPGLKHVPVFNMSLMGGYTSLSAVSSLSLTPGDISMTDATSADVDFDNQEMTIDATSFTMNLLVSANLPVVCFYGGIGFATSNLELGLAGNYPIATASASGIEITDASVLTDPLNIAIENTDGSTTNPRYNIGMRLKLGVITFHGDYTYANYSVVTAGVGVSIR